MQASRSDAPSASRTASTPLNVSPAPVVSTASAGGAGTTSPVERTRHPFAPSVVTTSPCTSPSAASSNSLGVKRDTLSASAGGSGRAGAGLNTIFTPFATAISDARRLTSSGTSLFRSRMSASAIAALKPNSTSAASSSMPRATVTRVSPVPSVMIAAQAVGSTAGVEK